jgi:hypothetical protein
MFLNVYVKICPPSSLFHKACLEYPPLYRNIRDVIVLFGIIIMEESINQRLSLKLALTIYSSMPVDLKLARANIARHDSAGVPVDSSADNANENLTVVHYGSAHTPDATRIAYNISMRSKGAQRFYEGITYGNHTPVRSCYLRL